MTRPSSRSRDSSMPSARLRSAVAHLAADGFVAYPTETVWGLGACVDRPVAIERLVAWKGRAAEAPMSVLVRSAESIEGLGCRVEAPARRLIEAFWPGPLTIVLPCDRAHAAGVARADRALGLRCSAHPLAHALAVAVDEAGLAPLTSTSLNRSGEPPAMDRATARALVGAGGPDGDVADPLLVDEPGLDAGGEMPSSVVDCTGDVLRILRVGSIDRVRLEEVWAGASDPRSGERES